MVTSRALQRTLLLGELMLHHTQTADDHATATPAPGGGGVSPDLIGFRVQRYWPTEGIWMEGVISAYNPHDNTIWCVA